MQIRLTRGYSAAVDDADYPAVSQYRWQAALIGRTVYAQRTVRRPDGTKTAQRLHTFLTGWPRVDHRDHDGLNNQRANLRPATKAENEHNSRSRLETSSRFKGVTWHRHSRRWQAQICTAGKYRYLGVFVSEDDAAREYDRAAVALFGEFAALNFPSD